MVGAGFFFFFKIYFFYFYFFGYSGSFCCCEWAFSSCREYRGYSCCGAQASPNGGFFGFRAWALGTFSNHTEDSVAEALGFWLSSFGTGAKLLYGMCSLPRAGVYPSPLHWQMDS